jgi:serine/threonine-protein kinase
MSLPTRVDRYEIGEAAWHGAVATCYRGHDTAMHRAVGLKIVAKEGLETRELLTRLCRFRQEAMTVARLDHPGISAFYDFLETRQLACMVTEPLEGVTLAAHLAAPGAGLDFAERWEIARQILASLAYCHLRGVVHRDLKPAHVVVGADGRVRITDFGMTRLAASSIAHLGRERGSVRYAAPEQCLGKESSTLTDLYQAATIVYELLTGERPFEGPEAELVRRVLHERPANPSFINPVLGAHIDWALQKALAKDPLDRFPSVRDFAEALRGDFQRRAA